MRYVRTKCRSFSAESSTSSSLSISEIWDYTSEENPDLVKVLILNKNSDRLCMIKDGELWDIPTFEYSDSVSNGHDIAKCYQDLKEWLGDAWSHLRFWFTTELLGNYFGWFDDDNRYFLIKMFFVEFPEELDPGCLQLPHGAVWKTAVELKELQETTSLVFWGVGDVAQMCMSSMQQNRTIVSNLNDRRSTIGWHSKASDFLTRTAFADGAEITEKVVQHHITSTSTILTVETSQGRYFLKTPSDGCNEVQITSLVGSLFPGFVPRVLASSLSLNCFVTREFDHVLPKVDDFRDVVQIVARLHHSSKDHIQCLAQNGCPVRNVKGLVAKMESWIGGEGILASDGYTVVAGRRHLKALLPFVKKLGEGLRDSNIPMTLVHGDLDISNLTRDPPGDNVNNCTFRLFDWQYAYIGHPFCDFHRMHEYLPEHCIDDYLRTWNGNEGMDRARALFERCWILGRFFKLMSLAEWLESNDTQMRPSLLVVMLRLIEVFYNSWVVREGPFTSSERRSL